MLEARKSLWFEKIFSFYNRNLFKRRFHSLQVSGLDNLRAKDPEIPLVVFANHSSWWDGLAAFEISRAARLDSYIMMEEKQLKKLQLFRKLGAFSVIRENPREAFKSLNYAVELLKNDCRRTLWIFPQGKIESNDLRPLKFYRGLSRIVEKIGRCQVACCAMRYEFLSEFKPQIFIKIGLLEIITADRNFKTEQKTSEFENTLARILDEMRSQIEVKDFEGYRDILEQRSEKQGIENIER